MDNIIIEKMNISHLDSISNILESDFDSFWNYNIFVNELKNKESTYIIAKQNNEIIGFAGITIILDVADITNIVVKKNFRGKGISKILLENLITLCKLNKCSKINLEVNEKNTIAINLYKKYNFKQVGMRKNYYKKENGLLFTKTI